MFYLGSGELWRLRRDGESRFDRLYDQILHFVMQGRDRPSLLVCPTLGHDALFAVDQICERGIAAKVPMAIRILKSSLPRVSDAEMPWIALRTISLDFSHAIAEQLLAIIDEQELLNAATRERQRTSLAHLGG